VDTTRLAYRKIWQNKTKKFEIPRRHVTFNDPKDTGSRGNVKNLGINKKLNIVLLRYSESLFSTWRVL
jgi:hypothetical protein